MNRPYLPSGLLLAASLFFYHPSATAQDTRAFNQNASRSNHTRAFNQNASRSNHTRLSLTLSPVISNPLDNAQDSLLFRGSGAGFRMGLDYFFGKTSIGFSTGFLTAGTDDNTLNNFMKRTGIPQDQVQITKAKQQNMYLLVGPSVRLGSVVEFTAHVKGGLFINNSGLINIQQKGAQRALYRNEATSKSIFPGFTSGIGVQYNTPSKIWSFGLGADYMYTQSQVMNYDARRAAGIEGLKLSRKISDLVTGITVRYSIPSLRREAGSGMATGRRVLPTVNKREAGSGMATGRRVLPTVNKREAGSGMATGRRVLPTVNKREINPGDCPCVEETEYIEMWEPDRNERRMEESLSSVKQGNNIIAGSIRWPSVINNSIITNKTNRGGSATLNSQTSSTRQTPNTSFGSRMILSIREAGSGMATGRRQYQPIYSDNDGEICNPCMVTAKLSSVHNNPLYEDKGMHGTNPLQKSSGENPLYQGNSHEGNNPLFQGLVADNDDDGIGGIAVQLIDASNNNVIAITSTETNGGFYFANVPDGNYIIRSAGSVRNSKRYDITIASKTNLLGTAIQNASPLLFSIATDSAAPQQKAGISTSRSNIRTKSMMVTTDNETGDMMAGNQYPSAAAQGDPVHGVDVKLGAKNGNSKWKETETNEEGVFEFSNIAKGDYALELSQNLWIEDETFVSLGMQTRVQDHNSSRSNKTASAILSDPSGDGATAPQLRAQNNNTVRSNRTDNALIINDPSATSTTTGPVKWMAPESIRRTVQVGKNDIASILITLDMLEQQLDADNTNAKALINTSRSNIKSQRIALSDLYESLDAIEMSERNAATNTIQQRSRQVDQQLMQLQSSLQKLGATYSSISNVLKTRHETAKNSISNIR